MTRIAVASGKGGTGKTLVATCLTQLLAEGHPHLIDADVEEPNDALLLDHQVISQREVLRPVPSINTDTCTRCGLCARECRFNALVVLPDEVLLLPELCHSCGVCAYVCPQRAIIETGLPCGTIERASLAGGGILSTGRLQIGEASPVFLIRETKRLPAGEITLIDCPPGTSCAMMEAIKDSDYCLLVTEPSPFGLHDLELALEAVKLQNLPCGVVVNRWRGAIPDFEDKLRQLGVEVLAHIPYSRELAQAYSENQNLLLAMPWLIPILSDVMAGIEARTS